MKRLLSTTMLIGFCTSSAMATDITISGSLELGYSNATINDPYSATTPIAGVTGTPSARGVAENNTYIPAEVKNGTHMYVQSDVNITFESTTDSGLTMKMNYGLDENGANDTANTDDINFSISGDFGEVYITGTSDDSATRRLDIEAAYTADEASTKHTIEDTGTYSSVAGEQAGGVRTHGTIVSYFLPTIIDGVAAGFSFSNGGTNSKDNANEWAVQYKNEFSGGSYTIHYGAGSSDNNGALASDARVLHGADAKGYGIEVIFGNLTIGSEQSYLDYHHPTVDIEFDQSASSVKYVMGDITLAYNIEQNTRSDKTNDDIERSAASISYAIAPGLTAHITTSSTKEDEGVNQDEDDVTIFALNATF